MTSPARPIESRLLLRIRYVECDPMGFLHHSNYLPFFEMGRIELLRLGGISYRELEERDVLFVVTRMTINYKRPARYDDEIEVVTRIAKQTHVRIDHAYEIFHAQTRTLLCTAESTIACITRAERCNRFRIFLAANMMRARCNVEAHDGKTD